MWRHRTAGFAAGLSRDARPPAWLSNTQPLRSDMRAPLATVRQRCSSHLITRLVAAAWYLLPLDQPSAARGRLAANCEFHGALITRDRLAPEVGASCCSESSVGRGRPQED